MKDDWNNSFCNKRPSPSSLSEKDEEQAAFLYLCDQGSAAEIEDYLRKNPATSFAQADPWGETPLMRAVKNENVEAFMLILEKTRWQAPEALNAQNYRGFTALMKAADVNDAFATARLIKAGADKTIYNLYGQNALMVAREKGFADIVTLLKGMEPDAPPPLPEKSQPIKIADKWRSDPKRWRLPK